jgi:hypothetical protein
LASSIARTRGSECIIDSIIRGSVIIERIAAPIAGSLIIRSI